MYGQTCLRARRSFGDRPLIVIRQIAAWKGDHFFAVVALLRRGKDNRVGQDVVDIISAHGAGKAEIADLDRRRTACEDSSPRTFGETHQIDGDIDLRVLYQPCHFRVALVADVMEVFESCAQPRAHLAPVSDAERERDGFEAFLIMVLEHPSGECRDRMVAEVRREIRQADATMCVDLAFP